MRREKMRLRVDMNMCERKATGIAGNWAAVARWLLSSLERVHRRWLLSAAPTIRCF